MNTEQHNHPKCLHVAFSGWCPSCQAARQERWAQQLAAAKAAGQAPR